jgi:hypothetical protein
MAAATSAFTDNAIALSAAINAGSKTTDEAVRELAADGDRDALHTARGELVARIYKRSDDYEATAALTLVNKALAAVGWYDPFTWKHRRKP